MGGVVPRLREHELDCVLQLLVREARGLAAVSGCGEREVDHLLGAREHLVKFILQAPAAVVVAVREERAFVPLDDLAVRARLALHRGRQLRNEEDLVELVEDA